MLLVMCCAAGTARAQDSAAVRAAQDLAATGRTDSARALLRRIAIERSNSPWADDALLQLVQLAWASGNAAQALDLANRLRSDYPGSELKSRAAFLGGRAAFDAGEPRVGCALLDSALIESGTDVEYANQIAFYRARCTGFATAPPAPAAPGVSSAPAAPSTDTASTPRPGFEVQVSATRSDQEARSIARRFESAGYAVRVARGEDGYTRVRIGPFRSREEAESAARAARIIVGGAPFVVPLP